MPKNATKLVQCVLGEDALRVWFSLHDDVIAAFAALASQEACVGRSRQARFRSCSHDSRPAALGHTIEGPTEPFVARANEVSRFLPPGCGFAPVLRGDEARAKASPRSTQHRPGGPESGEIFEPCDRTKPQRSYGGRARSRPRASRAQSRPAVHSSVCRSTHSPWRSVTFSLIPRS